LALKPKEEYILMPGVKFPSSICIIEIIAKEAVENTNLDHLFFINLGIIRKMSLKSTHYKKSLLVAPKYDWHPKKPKSTFFKHCGFKGAGASHIDDK
jgi:hypothetical protein